MVKYASVSAYKSDCISNNFVYSTVCDGLNVCANPTSIKVAIYNMVQGKRRACDVVILDRIDAELSKLNF